MSEMFTFGHIISAKKAFDESSAKFSPGEMMLSENDYRKIGKLLGKSDEEIEEALKKLPSLNLDDLEY